MSIEAGTAHVVGAGVAGLAAAIELAAAGRRVTLYETGRHAGGRCRSYFDTELGCRLDNGNHLLLAGNKAALRYLEMSGALGMLDGPREAIFPFIDAATGERWVLRPNRGVFPWWIFSAKRRVPGTRAADYLAAAALRRAPSATSVAAVLDRESLLFRRLWEPLAVAALNTGAEDASARMFWQILAETLGRGGSACRPLVPRDGLSETFVDPALATLRALGAEICFGALLRSLRFETDRVSELVFDTASIRFAESDSLILAVPASVAARLAPGILVPDANSPIVNAHFRCSTPTDTPLFVGVIGGAAEWVFRKQGVLSVTVSAADRFVDLPAEELRRLLWSDAAMAFQLPQDPIPPARIVKERRATFRASPEQLRRRPGSQTGWKNLILAGDYVDTGLPATIEGAIRSGFAAARQVLAPFRHARSRRSANGAVFAVRTVLPRARGRERVLP